MCESLIIHLKYPKNFHKADLAFMVPLIPLNLICELEQNLCSIVTPETWQLWLLNELQVGCKLPYKSQA